MANWKGAASGATSGALAGSAFGPWGTAIGGVTGGTLGFFSGNKDKNKQISTLTPEQQQLLRNTIEQSQNGQVGQNYGQANDYISRLLGGDQQSFDQWAAPQRTQFEQQVIPRLSERFSGLGGGMGGGVGSSSGFGQAIGGASAQFNSNLAGLYAQLQQQAAQQAFGQHNTLANMGLSAQAFQPAYQPGNAGFGTTALSGILEGGGKAVGQNFGNSLSSRFANMFGNNNQNQSQSNNSGSGDPYGGYMNEYGFGGV
jgi:Glycine zipper